jgi:hypothetical protein
LFAHGGGSPAQRNRRSRDESRNDQRPDTTTRRAARSCGGWPPVRGLHCACEFCTHPHPLPATLNRPLRWLRSSRRVALRLPFSHTPTEEPALGAGPPRSARVSRPRRNGRPKVSSGCAYGRPAVQVGAGSGDPRPAPAGSGDPPSAGRWVALRLRRGGVPASTCLRN